jgi:hypothetical protein
LPTATASPIGSTDASGVIAAGATIRAPTGGRRRQRIRLRGLRTPNRSPRSRLRLPASPRCGLARRLRDEGRRPDGE